MTPSPSRSHPPLGVLFDAHFTYVWNVLRRLGVRPADLEDLVHDVFIRVGAHLSAYDPERPVRPWLFGFAYRVAAEHRRRARNRLEVLGLPLEPIDPGRPADQRMQARERSELR